MNNNGTFHLFKKYFALITGIAVMWISAQNSKNGFVDGNSDSLLIFMGWAFAAATVAAQLMVTSDFRRLNWSLIFLGACAYVYSITTNILGLQEWRGTVMRYDLVNILGGIFMDVYPEAAIAWALNESKLGDVVGNFIKATKRGDELSDTGPRKPQQEYTYPRPPRNLDEMNSIRRQSPYQPRPAQRTMGLGLDEE